jgi:hypothetical protein
MNPATQSFKLEVAKFHVRCWAIPKSPSIIVPVEAIHESPVSIYKENHMFEKTNEAPILIEGDGGPS